MTEKSERTHKKEIPMLKVKSTCFATAFSAALFLGGQIAARASEPAHEDVDKGKAATHNHNHAADKHESRKQDGHAHEGHGHAAAHGHKATGMTDSMQIFVSLHENLACMEKELGSESHDAFHACLESIAALGKDIIALKTPVDARKKKRVNGYARNLGMMAHKVDEYKDAKDLANAANQLKKLKSQVALIEAQFQESGATGKAAP